MILFLRAMPLSTKWNERDTRNEPQVPKPEFFDLTRYMIELNVWLLIPLLMGDLISVVHHPVLIPVVDQIPFQSVNAFCWIIQNWWDTTPFDITRDLEILEFWSFHSSTLTTGFEQTWNNRARSSNNILITRVTLYDGVIEIRKITKSRKEKEVIK